ncbi:urotensin-2 [Pteropus medius]|uniref:urotensin-2 n=1 Tax=Pteropus vampyrus TaxID=132908 RepID=UPI00196B3A17|nr:urotensin-2 [Pteropus giganteus]
MYKLASCCLLFIGCLSPLFSLPVLDSREQPLQLSAPGEDSRSASGELESMSLLQRLPGLLGAVRGNGLSEADPSVNVFNTRGSMRKAFSGQDPDILLSRILARMRKHKKRSSPSECFWKYCV